MPPHWHGTPVHHDHDFDIHGDTLGVRHTHDDLTPVECRGKFGTYERPHDPLARPVAPFTREAAVELGAVLEMPIADVPNPIRYAGCDPLAEMILERLSARGWQLVQITVAKEADNAARTS